MRTSTVNNDIARLVFYEEPTSISVIYFLFRKIIISIEMAFGFVLDSGWIAFEASKVDGKNSVNIYVHKNTYYNNNNKWSVLG